MLDRLRNLFRYPEPSFGSDTLEGLMSFEDSQTAWEEAHAIVDAEPEPVYEPLPPYDVKAPCPKCHFERATTQYRPGFHAYRNGWSGAYSKMPRLPPCPVPGLPDEPPVMMFSTSMSLNERCWSIRLGRQARAVPEHFDRECPNCKYTWAEGVTDA